MTKKDLQRSHARSLIQKLLLLQEGISPLNIIHDTLDQSARPLLREYVLKGKTLTPLIIKKSSGTQTTFVSLSATKSPFNVQHFVRARRRSIESIHAEVKTLVAQHKRNLIIFDSVEPIPERAERLIQMISDVASVTVSVVIVIHSGEPLGSSAAGPYAPNQLYMLDYLATTIFHISSIDQAKSCHRAAEAGGAEPSFGLESGIEGVLVGRGANTVDGLLIKVEHRRKSGRAIGLAFILHPRHVSMIPDGIILADEHPDVGRSTTGMLESEQSHSGMTFDLSLTYQQRQAREEVVLPYYDAQRGDGAGGRILYDLGKEDDFDEEEDEI